MTDQFTPAARVLVVATKSAGRYFDLDAVRDEPREHELKYGDGYGNPGKGKAGTNPDRADGGFTGALGYNVRGAPPLDWWKVSDDYEPPKGEPMGMATWYTGDALEVLRTLPAQSVDLVMTSPPFLALRSYLPADHESKALEIGSEATPGAFLDVLLDVTEELARVLAPHGSLVVELGDTYSGSGGAGGDYAEGGMRDGAPGFDGSAVRGRSDIQRDTAAGIVPAKRSAALQRENGGAWPLAKSLCMIPSSYAWALAYGRNPWTGRTTPPWRVRNLVAWCRPNPPVGALGDKFRPATSYLTVACKSPSRYFDLDAVRHPQRPEGNRRLGANVRDTGSRRDDGSMFYNDGNAAGAPPLDWWAIADSLTEPTEALLTAVERGVSKASSREAPSTRQIAKDAIAAIVSTMSTANPAGAPPLDWWEIPTHPYPGAHYATFPPELCVRPIKSMCPQKVCRVCGKPSERITGEPEYVQSRNGGTPAVMHFRDGDRGDRVIGHGVRAPQNLPTGDASVIRTAETLGWSDCGHSADGSHWRNGIVLDPFAGSGTTLAVATGHGRDAIGIDLDAKNAGLARERIGGLFFSEAEVA